LNADRAPQLKASVSRLPFREGMKLPGSISFAFLLLLAAFGQVVDRPRVFDPVPVTQRVQLAERLKLLVIQPLTGSMQFTAVLKCAKLGHEEMASGYLCIVGEWRMVFL
jgi:hypothetical protein